MVSPFVFVLHYIYCFFNIVNEFRTSFTCFVHFVYRSTKCSTVAGDVIVLSSNSDTEESTSLQCAQRIPKSASSTPHRRVQTSSTRSNIDLHEEFLGCPTQVQNLLDQTFMSNNLVLSPIPRSPDSTRSESPLPTPAPKKSTLAPKGKASTKKKPKNNPSVTKSAPKKVIPLKIKIDRKQKSLASKKDTPVVPQKRSKKLALEVEGPYDVGASTSTAADSRPKSMKGQKGKKSQKKAPKKKKSKSPAPPNVDIEFTDDDDDDFT